MIKMFLDDSLHHTYNNYVDQPFTYFAVMVTWATISYQFCLGGYATFCNKVVFCI